MKKSTLIIVFALITFSMVSSCKKDESKPTNDFTGNSGTFSDQRDSKTYEWVRIGTQIWLARNLDFSLPSGTWYYSSNSNLSGTYGRLYTHEAALLAIPEGWHLPSVQELNVLSDLLGGASIAGGKLKQQGTSNWTSPNTGADNTSGFSALPGGMYDPGDGFYEKGVAGYFWTSTYSNSNVGSNIRYYYLENNSTTLNYTDSTDPALGLSVRCIKD